MLGVSDLGVTELLAKDQWDKSVVVLGVLGMLVLLLDPHPLHHVLFIEHGIVDTFVLPAIFPLDSRLQLSNHPPFGLYPLWILDHVINEGGFKLAM